MSVSSKNNKTKKVKNSIKNDTKELEIALKSSSQEIALALEKNILQEKSSEVVEDSVQEVQEDTSSQVVIQEKSPEILEEVKPTNDKELASDEESDEEEADDNEDVDEEGADNEGPNDWKKQLEKVSRNVTNDDNSDANNTNDTNSDAKVTNDTNSDAKVTNSTNSDAKVTNEDNRPDFAKSLPNPYILNFKSRKNKNNIGLGMMVKNEKLRIHVSLQSVLGFVSNIIIFDTGSTDNTIEIIVKFCKKYKIPLYLIQGTFKNFSVSRNKLLDFADTVTDIEFLLLLDCNDELQNGPALIKFCQNAPIEESGFFLMQRWKAMIFIDYFNIRLIKVRHNWRYTGVVHEYISSPGQTPNIKVPDVIIYQDRTQDDNKSMLRFAKDRDLLLEEYATPDKTPRTVYYLAQTYECMGLRDEAIKYYSERIHLEGFFEERYHAAYHVGQLMREKGELFEKYSGFHLKSLEFMHRAEPLVRIGEYYISIKSWIAAYYVLFESCRLVVPECGLFVDIELYKYYRWHLLGIVSFYVKEYKVGLNACEIAVNYKNNTIDINNRNFYKNALSSKSETEKMKSS